MTTIAAKDVAELRARTGAGMMDSKRALEEAGGDMARAAELLRAKGIAKAETRAGRSTSQGLVVVGTDAGARNGAMIELVCETDFVARNEDFVAAADALLAQALGAPPMTTEAFLGQPAEGGTVADWVKTLSGKTGESVALRNVVRFAAGPEGTVGLYQHFNRQVGVMVELQSDPTAARAQAAADLAREIALHVASADPIAVRAEDIPAEVVERERRIAEEQVAQEGKPEAVRGKIVEGKLRKFIAERTLMEQPWVKDDKRTVGQLVAETAKALGAEVRVVRFARLKVGEG